jgi:hypothetical protein
MDGLERYRQSERQRKMNKLTLHRSGVEAETLYQIRVDNEVVWQGTLAEFSYAISHCELFTPLKVA